MSGDDDGQPAASSVPEGPFLKATALNTACSELRTSLLDEVNSIETKLIRPATDAKDSLKPLKKSIKRREDLKVRSLFRASDQTLTLDSWILSDSLPVPRMLGKRRRRVLGMSRL